MTSVNLDQNFGYLINRFQDPDVAKKYTCSICTNVLKNPVQIDTAEPKLACYKCYTDNRRDGKCPLSGKYNIKYHQDIHVDKIIKKLVVTCENKEFGCKWFDELQQFENHVPVCDFRCILCTHCGQLGIYCCHKSHCPDSLLSCLTCARMSSRKNNEETGESHRATTSSKDQIITTLMEMIKEKDFKDQLLHDKVTQLETQNLELRKTAESLIAGFIELNETVEAMNKEVGILQAKLSQQQRCDVDGGHTGAFQNYREWYGFYGLIEDHRRIVSQNNVHLQLQENVTNHESVQRSGIFDQTEMEGSKNQ